MTSENWYQPFRINQRLADTLAYIVIAVMLGCVSVSFVQFAERLSPGWQGGHLVWLSFLVALEAMASRRLMRKQMLNFFSWGWWLYHLSELVVVMLILKTILYIRRGFDLLIADTARWQQEWFAFFDDGELLGGMGLLFVIWLFGTAFYDDLWKMRTSQRDLLFDEIQEMELDRIEGRKSMIGRIFSVGMLMVFLAAVVRLDMRQIWGDKGPINTPLINVLIYFGLSFLIMSLSQFSLLRGRWMWEQSKISIDMAKRWFQYALLFFVTLIILAFILPSGYSVGLLDVLRIGMNLIWVAIQYFYLFFATLVSLLLAPIMWLMSIFSGEQVDQNPLPEFTPPPVAQPESIGGNGMPWLDVLRSIVFWVVFVGIAVFAVLHFVRQNKEIWNTLARTPVLRWAAQLMKWLREKFGSVKMQLSGLVEGGLERLKHSLPRPSRTALRRFFHPRFLDPREQIMFYYLAMLRRGEDGGFRRSPSETPQHYAQFLRDNLPGNLDPDLSNLTQDFLEAKYSQHEITMGRAEAAKRYWYKILDMFRAFRKSQ